MGTSIDLTTASSGQAAPEFVERLRAACRQTCADCDLQIDWVALPDGGLEVVIAGQENAPPELMLQAFVDEARAKGLEVGPRLHLGGVPANRQDRVVEALRGTLQRLRTLLIEHNSYTSGGLAYPFVARHEGLAERGLSIYRYPARGAVDVRAVGDGVDIDFAPGALGEVTSSGFYLPTLFEGDFELQARYRLGTWRPGATRAACFALFAQNQASSHRYYAQRMSTGDAPHRLLASLADQLSPEREVVDPAGRLRVVREGDRISCAHAPAEGGSWTELGSAAAPPEPEMLFGAKIWSSGSCNGLQVRVTDLQIEGTLARAQLPPPARVPDPRSNPDVGPS